MLESVELALALHFLGAVTLVFPGSLFIAALSDIITMNNKTRNVFVVYS